METIMKIIDNIPIIIVNAVLLINIALGIRNDIGFSTLMIRCIIVIIISYIFSYMIARTIGNALENSRLNREIHAKENKKEDAVDNLTEKGNEPILDIKVPPLDEKEFFGTDSDNDNKFIEMNPINMGSYNQISQD